MDITQHIICCTSHFYMFNSMDEICVAKNCSTRFVSDHIGGLDHTCMYLLAKYEKKEYREKTNKMQIKTAQNKILSLANGHCKATSKESLDKSVVLASGVSPWSSSESLFNKQKKAQGGC